MIWFVGFPFLSLLFVLCFYDDFQSDFGSITTKLFVISDILGIILILILSFVSYFSQEVFILDKMLGLLVILVFDFVCAFSVDTIILSVVVYNALILLGGVIHGE